MHTNGPTELPDALVRNDEEGAASAARRLGRQMTHHDLLCSLIPRAAQSLQLYYATPHTMIALEYTLRALPAVGEPTRAQLVDAYVRYLAAKQRTLFSFERPAAHGEPYFDDLDHGLVRSLDEHRVFDACFYAVTLADSGKSDVLSKKLREIASHEVDGLGHVFIHTTTALELLKLCDAGSRAQVLMAMVEFLSRNAEVTDWSMLSETRSLAELLPGAFQRIHILGHNIIYANQLRQEVDRFGADYQEHLLAQLARNIDAADAPLTLSHYRKQRQQAPVSDGPPLARLERAFEEGDLAAGFRAMADAWTDAEARGQLPEALTALFARLDTHQPHFLIYPLATFELLPLVDEETGELAIAQLVNLGISSAREDGMRPRISEEAGE